MVASRPMDHPYYSHVKSWKSVVSLIGSAGATAVAKTVTSFWKTLCLLGEAAKGCRRAGYLGRSLLLIEEDDLVGPLVNNTQV